jgi:hypothetical protein
MCPERGVEDGVFVRPGDTELDALPAMPNPYTCRVEIFSNGVITAQFETNIYWASTQDASTVEHGEKDTKQSGE